MKIAIVVGTRPEVIKMSPIIRECEKRNLPFVLIHSNQHYSPSMDEVFFKELKLPAPHYNANVGAAPHGNQTGNILIKMEPILEKEKPDVVLVQGDTNTVVAAAMAASKLGIKIGHVEAGLRSYDRTMPEETNRVVTDHLSDFLFAVTAVQEGILKQEGIPGGNIYVVGNTVADALLKHLDLAETSSTIRRDLKLKDKEYVLFTAHRSSNVDYANALSELILVLDTVHKETGLPVVWPMHPRAKKQLEEFQMHLPAGVIPTDPLGYLDFVSLENGARLIITDSGGLQEEAAILGVPCLTIRENTERPETVQCGANILIGRDPQKLRQGLKFFEKTVSRWQSPFGDGKSASRICDVLQRAFGEPVPGSEERQNKTISVIGLGYMGLPTAALLCRGGYRVYGVDLLQSKVDRINSGEIPLEEKGLRDLVRLAVKEGGFKAGTQLQSSDVYLIAVPTPHQDGKCDLTHVMSACEDIARVALPGQMVILESTVKPGTCERIIAPFFKSRGLDLLLAHCPERAIPGNTLFELVHNDRIVGGLTNDATRLTETIYASFVRGKIYKTSAGTAEVVKLMENTFRDVNIALANEFYEVCKELGVNGFQAIDLANKHPRVNILSPGPGVGGHCIAIDPWFLIEDSTQARLIRLAREMNDQRPLVIVKEIERRLTEIRGTKVGILGVAYKKNVDDARETPALTVMNALIEREIPARAYDPYVKNWDYPLEKDLQELLAWSDLLVIVTDHDEFKKLTYSKPVYDTRNCLRQDETFV